MRYSRMLEESSFANKRADYFWLLLQSAIMLLVTYHFPIQNDYPDILYSVPFPSFQSSFSFFPARFRSYLCLVKASSFNTNFFVWSNKHHSTLLAICTYCIYMAPDWHMEICSR